MSAASLCLRLSPHTTVHLYEKNTWLGGKLRRIKLGDQFADLGPSIFTLPQIWESYRSMCQSFPSAPPLAPLQLNRISGLGAFASEELIFELPPQTEVFKEAWQNYFRKHVQNEQLIVSLMSQSPSSLASAWKACQLLWRLGGSLTVERVLRREGYSSTAFRDALAIHSLNAGLSPKESFSLFASLPALLAKSGVFIPEGGMYELVSLFEKDLQPLGHALPCIAVLKSKLSI